MMNVSGYVGERDAAEPFDPHHPRARLRQADGERANTAIWSRRPCCHVVIAAAPSPTFCVVAMYLPRPPSSPVHGAGMMPQTRSADATPSKPTSLRGPAELLGYRERDLEGAEHRRSEREEDQRDGADDPRVAALHRRAPGRTARTRPPSERKARRCRARRRRESAAPCQALRLLRAEDGDRDVDHRVDAPWLRRRTTPPSPRTPLLPRARMRRCPSCAWACSTPSRGDGDREHRNGCGEGRCRVTAPGLTSMATG